MGPLKGIRIIEFGGIGPGPFAALMLADMGAEIIRIDRKGVTPESDPAKNIINRGRRSVALDLKNPASAELILQLVEEADAIIEGFRPGVMERLGLGPDICLQRNPRLIYGRMTGWGQSGPLAHAAGHDINYIALTGALHATGTPDKPVVPLNLVGDYGGGGMMLALGIACGLWETTQSGKGQVIDAAMTDGAAILMSAAFSMRHQGRWSDTRGENWLDGNSAFYGTYECADGKWISIGSLEPQFYSLLLDLLGLTENDMGDRWDIPSWPNQREMIASIFKLKSRQQWCDIMEGTDVCFAPVLDLNEAQDHPHNKSRGTFVEIDGLTQPAPTPRFSRSKANISYPPPCPGEHNDSALKDWGITDQQIKSLRESDAM